MNLFKDIDIIIVLSFFIINLLVGFISGKKDNSSKEEFLLSSRNVGLFLFILTNVATWYGGILGIGEFTYRYGLLSWFSQGFPYYVFALIFALLFAPKIRSASLYTIPDKINEVYGEKAAVFAAMVVFILVSPAAYLLMTALIIQYLFHLNLMASLIVSFLLSSVYLIKSGYKGDLYTDAFQFFVMFIGFIVVVLISYFKFGGLQFIKANVPPQHLTLTGGASPAYVIVWFLIALWTFADPGFHQRCYAAKTPKIARNGIIISIALWALFDFLTTSTGLYARAILPNLKNPANSYLYYAQKVLAPGVRGLFYAGLFATIMSTFNSLLFLSGTTFSNDILSKFFKNQKTVKYNTTIGIFLSGIIGIIIAYLVPSVIELWYLMGSICIPSIILPIVSAYFPKYKINSRVILVEMIMSFITGLVWYFIRPMFQGVFIIEAIEPMIAGLVIGALIHIISLLSFKEKHEQNVLS